MTIWSNYNLYQYPFSTLSDFSFNSEAYSNLFSMPAIPRYSVSDYNIFGFTPSAEFCALSQNTSPQQYFAPINLTNPFSTYNFQPKINTDSIFGFLNPKVTPNVDFMQMSQPSTSANNFFGFLTSKVTSQVSTNSNITANNSFGFLNVTQQCQHGKMSSVKKQGLPSSVIAEEVNGYSIIKYGRGIALQNLKSDVKEKLILLDKKAKSLGYTLVVSDGWRSHEEQRIAKQRKPHLAATPGKSAHEYGAALDLALYKDGRHIDIGNVKEFYEYAESIGLEWGGRWRKPHETWHFNVKNWKTRADIASEYNYYNNRVA